MKFKTTNLNASLLAFSKKPGMELVILFGSHAKGTSRLGSDLDVAIAMKKTPDLLSYTNELMQRTHINDVDLVDLKRCSPVLGMQVLKGGKVIFQKPGALGSTGSYICRRYADTKKFRDANRESINLFLKKKRSK